MILRYLTQDDVREHDKVTSQAFSYACDINDPASVLPCEKVLGAFDDDNKTLLADFEINERTCCFGGGTLTCAAVGGVAAKPEHRGKGAVKALFEYLFTQTDYDISILYPFSEAYYRKLGYERVGRSVSATVPFSDLCSIKRNNDVTLFEGNSPERLLELYNRCARQYNLGFVRENAAAFSDKPYESQRFTYIWKNHSFATITIDRDKSTVFVSELYFDSCEALCGILGFLRNYESNQQYVCFQKLPDSSPLFSYLPDLKHCDIRIGSTGSARILNVENVLKRRRYSARGGEFTLQVGDEAFRVSCSESDVKVDRDSGCTPDVIMDINTASGILLSGLADKAYIPHLVVNNPASDFFSLFPPETAFFTDGF